VFSEKLESQGWLDLFTDIKRGCSIPDLVEFYTNCVITNRVVTSTINNHDLRFDAKKVGELLGCPPKVLMCMCKRTRASYVKNGCWN